MNMEWQPIETAPKDGVDILVYDKGFIFTAYWDGEHMAFMSNNCVDGYNGTDKATHWMPLPGPPTEDSE